MSMLIYTLVFLRSSTNIGLPFNFVDLKDSFVRHGIEFTYNITAYLEDEGM